MNNFILSVEETIKKFNMLQNNDTVVVAVSGGADSIAMLYSLYILRDKYNLNLICAHLNHGIRGLEADSDEEYVKQFANKLGIECITKYVDVPEISRRLKKSEELVGREQRYNFFNEIISGISNGKIAVAHNKNDFAETVLMKLVRGTSLKGLRGIPQVNGNIIRPLIETERSSVEEFLKLNNISYRTDSTNNQDIYTRNFIRNNIIKQLTQINPSFIDTVYNNCSIICEDDDFIDIYASKHFNSCVQTVNNKCYIDLKAFNDLHISVKKRIIKQAVSCVKGNVLDMENKHYDILINLNKTGKKYDILSDLKAYVEYDKLILCTEIEDISDYLYEVEFDKTYYINNISIKFERITNNYECEPGCMYVSGDNVNSIKIRNFKSGDVFVPSGMTNKKKVNRFFIDNKVSQTERKTIPILCINDDIAAIIGYRVSNNYMIKDETKSVIKISYSKN